MKMGKTGKCDVMLLWWSIGFPVLLQSSAHKWHKKNRDKNVHPSPAYWSKCKCVGTCMSVTIYYLRRCLSRWHRLESLLLYNFFSFYYNTLFLCTNCTNDFRSTLTHVSTCFVFLSPSDFLSPGILPSSLDGKKFMWSSKLLLLACVCVLRCVFVFLGFFVLAQSIKPCVFTTSLNHN